MPFAILVRVFGGFDVLALVFHAQFGVEGATLGGFETEVIEGSAAVAIIVFAGFAIGNLFGRQMLTYAVAFIALVALNPLLRFGVSYLGATEVESDLHMWLSRVEIVTSPKVLPDIVIVYLEGLERTYGRRELFGDIYAPLEKYAQMGVSFTQVRQVRATGWSLAGMAARQCGVPLLPNGFRTGNNFTKQTSFLGAHTCLGDVTAELGYHNFFLFGGSKNLVGLATF